MSSNVEYDIKNIRNIAIVAHIDHGKSTLADRLIDLCLGSSRNSIAQQLDNLEVERRRGITVRSQTVRLPYNGMIYNIIDTPGHADFAQEVCNSLRACEGVVLLVDAPQGVQAQTLAHIQAAKKNSLVVVPVVNKIDLIADPEDTRLKKLRSDLQKLCGDQEIVYISAKTGKNVDLVLEAIKEVVPPPIETQSNAAFRAFLVDSWYDTYHGAVMLVKVANGTVRSGDYVQFVASGKRYKVTQVGILIPGNHPVECLHAGEVGYILAGVKDPRECVAGDTIGTAGTEVNPVCKFQRSIPVVFCGIFPTDSRRLDDLRSALNKLNINDPSFTFEIDRSPALGMGFRCGFLGLLHLEVIQERLQEEFAQEIFVTIPSVPYKICSSAGGVSRLVSNPTHFPEALTGEYAREPWAECEIIVTDEYMNVVIEACKKRRGILREVSNCIIGDTQASICVELPLSEIIFDFHDHLKSCTSGHVSFNYRILEYRESELAKMRILINGEEESTMSMIVHKSRAYDHGRKMCLLLKEQIPRHNIVVRIQAAIGGKIIASESLSAYRKDVTAKCYGGHVERKKKLLEKQRKGKARMQQTGKVHIPNEAYIALMRLNRS